MKKYLLIALAALGFAACENVNDEINPGQSGELEKSYVAISLAADDFTKAGTEGVYEDGLAAEYAVKSAHVFFFKNSEPFAVSYDATNETTTNAGQTNFLNVTNLLYESDNTETPNVTDVKGVLVLQNYEGEYPDQIFAVLNWTPDKAGMYQLSELKTKTALGNETNGYVMSNAVYADKSDKVIDVVPLTVENIAKSPELAQQHPVTIYVERVAAKVVFDAKNNGEFYIDEQIDGKPIIAKITGFELYNDYEDSWLVKRIDTAWDDEELGFTWNNPAWHRSYWATSLGKAFPENHFAWTETGANHKNIGEYDYCGENTRAWTEAEDVRTKVIVKAQLGTKEGTTFTPVTIANWYGKDYNGENNLLTEVANTLKNIYYSSVDGQTFVGILPEDLKCVARDASAKNAYESYFQLSDTGVAKTWYKNENGSYTAVTNLNDTLAALQPALVYTEGMTYYWTDIRHLGVDKDDLGYYGVVRNHVYKVNITDIKGFGTPVYDPTIDFITPEKPTEVIDTYVAAEIKILSWRVVEYNYELN